jgi:hypothetical protein
VSQRLFVDWSGIVNPERFDGYVREIERHKSRNDCTSYEVVYIAESGEGKPPIGVPFADLYGFGQCWLEIEMVFVLFGNTHLKCVFVVEMFDFDARNSRDEWIDPSRVNREELVLVEIAKFIQLPKGMSLRRIRSLVRLNSINLSPDIVRESPQRTSIIAPSTLVDEVLGNGEVNISRGILPSSGRCELPSHLVKTRPETVKEFAEFHPDNGVERFHLKPFDVASVARIVLANDGVRFFHVGGHMPVQSVKVKLCPFSFHYEIPCGAGNHFHPSS